MKSLLLPAFVGMLLGSCSPGNRNSNGSAQPAAGQQPIAGKEIPYTLARNYFLNSPFQAGDLASPAIRSQADFEKFFGIARTMGPEGKPTPVDFSTHYVIAVTGAETSYKTTLSVIRLSQEKEGIVLRYRVTRGEKLSAIIQPVLLLVVSREYTGDVVLKEE